VIKTSNQGIWTQKHKSQGRTQDMWKKNDTPKFNNHTVTDNKDSEEKDIQVKNSKT
jgi:hypothetical protein